jgi:Amt family ammonium transporter
MNIQQMAECGELNFTDPFIEDGNASVHGKCIAIESSKCDCKTYSDRYDDASASWVILCAILIFFMRAGFLHVEMAFSVTQNRRKVFVSKFCDFFAGTFGFWLFGYAISGNTDAVVMGAEQDYIFWFFRLLFATNAATLIGGTLVGQHVQMRIAATFVYSFMMTAFIHPGLAYFFWSSHKVTDLSSLFSPYQSCNGTFTSTINHEMTYTYGEVRFAFYDLAGCGLVHVCGGTAAFVLSLFHKLETSQRAKKLQNLPLLRRKDIVMKGLQSDIDVKTRSQISPKGKWKLTLFFKNFIQWMYTNNEDEQNMIEGATLGVFILWTSWFCYSAGATEAITGKRSHAIVGRIAVCLCLSAASGGMTQATISGLVQVYTRHTHYNTNELANAVLASMVAVTGCCAFIEPQWALLIGTLTVFVYHAGCFIEYAFELHDGTRVFPVHAVCGFWGLLCVGFFRKACFVQELYENLCYCISSDLPPSVKSHKEMLLIQSVGGLFIFLWSLVLVTVLFTVMWYFPVKVVLACLPR